MLARVRLQVKMSTIKAATTLAKGISTIRRDKSSMNLIEISK